MPADDKAEYAVGHCKPPLHSRFKKGQSGNPRGRSRGAKNVATLLFDALDRAVVVTEDGRRRKVSKSELGIAKLVDRFAEGDPNVARLLLGLMLELARRPLPDPTERPPLGAADKMVIENLLARMRA
jgi:Family of unknown function (DUF5681)